MTKTRIKAALIQQANSLHFQDNLNCSLNGIKEAASKQTDLVLLQELHSHLYFCQTQNPDTFDLAESIPGPTTEQLAAAARQYHIVIVGCVFEKRMAGVYHNTAVVIDRNGEIAGIYRKMHIPDDPGFYEKYYFTPGDMGFTPIDCSLGRLGVLICWDQWYPEAARLMALAGAELLLYPTAIGWQPRDPIEQHQKQLNAWTIAQQAHAIYNSLPVLCCNRVGTEAGPNQHQITFWGSSFITDCQGAIIASASPDHHDIIYAEIDTRQIETTRKEWPYLRDRRIDAYANLMQRAIDD